MARLAAKLECPQSPQQSAATGCRAQVEPGDELTCRLLVYNAAEKVDEIRTQLSGPLAPWTRVEPDRLPLMPEHEGELELTLWLPVDARVEAGQHPLLVEVRSGLPDTEPAVEECLVEVGSNTDAQLSVRPGPGGPRYGWYEVVIESGSNHWLRLNLNVAASVPVEVPPEVIEIPPFGRTTTRVRVDDTGMSGQQVGVTVTVTGDGVQLRAELSHVVSEAAPHSATSTEVEEDALSLSAQDPGPAKSNPTPELPRCMSKALALAAVLATVVLYVVSDQSPLVLVVAALAALWLSFGYAGCRIVTLKGRRRRSGWALGMLLGPFGLVIAAVLSDAKAQGHADMT